MLAPALRRDRGHGAFHQFQQGLLHAFAAHITGDAGVFGFARDFINFVDIDDAALCTLDIVFGRLQQLEDNVFNIFPDIARFGQRRRIGHGKGHIQNTRQRLRQQRLTAARGPDQQDVGFRQFDVPTLLGVVETFIVVVHGNRQHPFGHRLPDHVIVQNITDVFRGRHTIGGFQPRGFGFLADDIHAKFDTFVTNEDSRTCNQLAHLMLTFATKAAIKCVLAVAARSISHFNPFRSVV